MPRRYRPSRVLPIRMIVQPHHLDAALNATRLLIRASADDIKDACVGLNWALHRVISSDRGLEPARSILQTLTRLEGGDLTALRSLGLQPNPEGGASGVTHFTHPVTTALAQAAQQRRLLDPEWVISDNPGQALSDVAALASMAADQYRAGIPVAMRRLKLESRRHGERLVFCAIGAYCQLTGRRAARSIGPDTSRHPGQLTGPLPRFLAKLYEQIRLTLKGEAPDPSGLEALNPAQGTLGRWIQIYKKEAAQTPATAAGL